MKGGLFYYEDTCQLWRNHATPYISFFSVTCSDRPQAVTTNSCSWGRGTSGFSSTIRALEPLPGEVSVTSWCINYLLITSLWGRKSYPRKRNSHQSGYGRVTVLGSTFPCNQHLRDWTTVTLLYSLDFQYLKGIYMKEGHRLSSRDCSDRTRRNSF